MDPNSTAPESLNQASPSFSLMESTGSTKTFDPEDERRKQEQHISDVLLWETEVKEKICRWAFECGIPFHAFENENFGLFLEALSQFGPTAQPPTTYEIREIYLPKEVDRMKNVLKEHEIEWKRYGCSIIIDSWSNRKTTSMNLCVHSRLGTVFLSSKESSRVTHMYEYLENCIQEVGQENIVQIVTINASNKIGALKLLKEKRPTIFWTPCATHTINLMLEGISDLPTFKKILDQAKALIVFIYNHHTTLKLMRSFTKKRELIRPGVTLFASDFLTLQGLTKKKADLRNMFSSIEWNECRYSKSLKGKYACEIVADDEFWEGVKLCLKVFSPLVKVLRMVDADMKPSMEFVYGEIMNAKEAIKDVLGKCKKDYEPIMDIISSKMKGRLDSCLHLTAYLLNPYYHYKDPNLQHDPEVIEAVLELFDKLFPGDMNMQHKIINVELVEYKKKEGIFGHNLAAKVCEVNNDMFDPASWWGTFGGYTNLRKIAMRILNLTTSSSGCERTWSKIDRVDTKRRDMLTTTELNNLIFVRFNANLMEKNKRNKKEKMEVLLASDDSEAQEWLVDEVEEELEPMSEEEVDEFDYESDEVHIMEEYGEDKD